MTNLAHNLTDDNTRKAYDDVLQRIADYVCDYTPQENSNSDEAYDTARNCLMDTLGCGFLALKFPQCSAMLGPVVQGADLPLEKGGVPVPGTAHTLDPIKAAFDIGCMVRWLDYNDTWLAAEWGHPSDNLGAILACTDYMTRHGNHLGKKNYTVHDILTYMIKAHEIQGVLALENSFNKVGLDHVVLVKVASTAVATHILGGTKQQVLDAVSHAWLDGQALRTYRHAPNTGSRKSWAAGDATSRAVRLALIVLNGEMGYPSVLTAPKWGFYDVLFKGKPFTFQRPFGSYVMEQILFKISFPAEFHSQTAVECAVKLHGAVKDRLGDIDRIELTTHEAAIRIISKTGALHNFADRDHCLQYMVAVPLIKGNLTEDDYSDEAAADKRIDMLREKMVVQENAQYSKDYHDPEKRSIANAIQVFFKDGTSTEKVAIEYPIGHRRRRAEGIPVLEEKFSRNLRVVFDEAKANEIFALCKNAEKLNAMPVTAFSELLRK